MNESVPSEAGRIFISYRREDTAFAAGWLYERLAERFGAARVFKDIDSIQLGEDFAEAIAAAVGSCAVLLALIGAQWLTVTGEQGQRRLDDPADFVRLEIEAALARRILVIPVIVEGARMPGAAELPASLRELTRRQALELRPGRFASDTRHLLTALDRALGGMPPAAEGTAGTGHFAGRSRAWPPRAGRSAAAVLAAAAAAAAGIYAVTVLLGHSAGPGGSTHGGTSPAAPASAVAGTPIPVGSKPDWIVIAPGGKTAYVANGGDATVTPIDLMADTPGTPIRVGNRPYGIAITPDGKTAYVVNNGDGTVTPVDLASGTPGTPIRVGNRPFRIAITPDGRTAYVTNQGDNTLTPIDLATRTAGRPIPAGRGPQSIVITQDGTTAYVADQGTDTITPVSLPADAPQAPITVGYYPDSITIAPDGRTAYTTDNGLETITPVDLAYAQARDKIVINSPISIAITADGKLAYVANWATASVTPVRLPSFSPGKPIKVGSNPQVVVITPDGKTAYVVNNGDGTVTPITLPPG